MTFLSGGDSDELVERSDISALNITQDNLSKYTQYITKENKNILEDKAIYTRVEQWTDPLRINCTEYYYDEASILISIYSAADRKLINTARVRFKSYPNEIKAE